jgi:hypothetical protein
MVDRGLEAVHEVLVHQHVVMVVDRDELPQVAALDFAFVQHWFLTMIGLRVHYVHAIRQLKG